MIFNIMFLIAALLISIVLSIILESWNTSRKYKHVQWAGGSPHQWWMLNLVRIRNLTTLKARHASIVQQFWAKDQAVFIPSLMGDQLVLPPIDFEWLLEQPDHLLDARAFANEITQAAHTLKSQHLIDNPYHIKTLSRDMTRHLGDVTGDIIDEVALVVEEEWGSSRDWVTITPYQTFLRIITRISNRAFVGTPLCRDPKFLKSSIALADTVIPLAILLRMLPKSLKPLLAPLVTYKNRGYRRQLREKVRPEVISRLQDMNGNENANVAPSPPRNDFLQWVIENALQSKHPQELQPDTLSDRMIHVNFAAGFSSTFTVTDFLFDLVSPPSSQEILSTLREEVKGVLAANNGIWTKSVLNQLTKLDSALRESARLGHLASVGFQRKLSGQPSGLTAPNSGTFIPEGADVGVPIHMIHRDANNYADPNTYQPFRFVTTTGRSSTIASLNFTTTSSSYLLFGHGRNACPGRFFAADELKLLMAYLVLNYDFEMLHERPERKWFGHAILCPMDEKIRIRRRSD